MGRKLADVDCGLDSSRIPTGSGSDVGTSGCRQSWLVGSLTGGRVKPAVETPHPHPHPLPRHSPVLAGVYHFKPPLPKGRHLSLIGPCKSFCSGDLFRCSNPLFYVPLSQPGVKCTFHQGYDGAAASPLMNAESQQAHL